MGAQDGPLRSYYEAEARARLRQPPTGRRVQLRDDFIELLINERRQSVLDLGAGPGSDGAAFRFSGFFFVGLDLAFGNAALAAANHVFVVQASIASPPCRPGSFDAGWSMSTLMHVPEDDVHAVLSEMVQPLRTGAPLVVGLWGGERRDETYRSDVTGEERLFSFRPLERNRELLAACGEIEYDTSWDAGPEGREYQVFQLRVR